MAETTAARLVALVRAGPFRLALPAAAVREVAQVGVGETVRGLEPVSLAAVLGAPAAGGGSWVVVLEGNPLQAYRVDAVEGVRDTGPAPFSSLPEGVGVRPPELFRGALGLGGSLALEVRPPVLERLGAPPEHPAPRLTASEEPVARALVAVAGGQNLGFPLTQVLAVISRPAICPVPRAAPGRPGIAEHGQTLYAVLDLAALRFGTPSTGEYGVLVELEGSPWLVLADAVKGVLGAFRRVGDLEPGWMEGERGERALFLQLEGR